MSVRHHEQLFSYQQREFQLTQSLRECSHALDEALSILQQQSGQYQKGGYSPIPPHLAEASVKFSMMATSLAAENGMSTFIEGAHPNYATQPR
jgi:hypothetical protein